jgi:prepilin-type N-terminal cleavage/methylation domain-containing protein
LPPRPLNARTRDQARRQPRRRRAGFSLIELFTVLLVLGILVGLAVPKYRRYKERYIVSAMLTDLRNLTITEEAHWSDVGVYSADLSALKFSTTPEVTITILSADSTGWSATTTHANSSSKCAVFFGEAAPVPPATVRTIIACD